MRGAKQRTAAIRAARRDCKDRRVAPPAAAAAWIDHIVRIRRTFRSAPAGKIGLLRDRPVIVISAHGGYCGNEPPAQPDFLTPYLRAIFTTIGIRSLEFVRLEGLARGPEAVTLALDGADTAIAAALPRLLQHLSPCEPHRERGRER